MDGQTLDYIAVGLASISLLARALDKSLSIREHEEFRANIRDQFLRVSEQHARDIDRLEKAIHTLEQTRPTTGEIAASLKTSK